MKLPFWGRFLSALALLVPVFATHAWETNLTPGVTPISQDIFSLHMTVFWVCVAIAVVVFGAMIYSIIHHRKSCHPHAAQFHESTTVEIIWTVIPFIILIAMAIPATKTLIAMESTQAPDLTVKITGYQWRWEYEYLGQNLRFVSALSTPPEQMLNQAPKDANYLLEVDKPLVLPVGKKVRFLITAADVNHAWWVPALGFKRDAIPGYVNDSWARIEKPGIYRGQCAELCGRYHGFMPIVVVAKPEAEFNQWLADHQQKNQPQVAAATP